MKEILGIYSPILPGENRWDRFGEIESAYRKYDETKKTGDKVFFDKKRLFISTTGQVGYFLPKSSRSGILFSSSDIIDGGTLFVNHGVERTEANMELKEFKMVLKFHKKAKSATFKNNFITDCLSLPDTFEKWVEEGKKTAYQYNITTGCRITGDIITLDCIRKKFKYIADNFERALLTKTDYRTCFDFRGYDCTISFSKEQEAGYLSLEYRGCGNGNYYLLINDKEFIGYDVD